MGLLAPGAGGHWLDAAERRVAAGRNRVSDFLFWQDEA